MSRRRRWALAGLLCGVTAVAVTVPLVAWCNPWHYVHLMPYGRPGVMVPALVLAPLLVAAAAWLMVRDWVSRGVVLGVAVLLSLVVWVGGTQYAAVVELSDSAAPAGATVVAVAPGGRFELVRLEYRPFLTLRNVVRVRSRAGLRSRESRQNIACFTHAIDGFPAPERVFGAARFVSDNEIEVTGGDGIAWRTAFDPRTMLTAQTLSRGCG
ncbi:hypothetical protein ABT297_09660 [Dactylosporangium sp. NPDC000555]|uniref:hypothetical protein n=1 Tax=Dactylosporangium sp. NPDC000555 TaxID=3154260 RepID=UPI003317426C